MKPSSFPGLLIASDLLDKLKDLPNNFGRIMSNAVALLVTITFFLGIVLSVIGIVRWARGSEEQKGKKVVVKGVILIVISLLVAGLGLTIAIFA